MTWRLFVILPILSIFSCAHEGSMLRTTDRIIFFGDSITQLGVKPGGYITIIKNTLTKKYPSIQILGEGISGNKVPDLQARIDTDVIAKKPSIVVVYIGINDVWHFITPGQTGTQKDVYESGLKDVISKIQKSGARVILCTPSVVGEKKNGANQLDAQLDEYSEISRRVGQEMKIDLCDLRNAFKSYLQTHNPNDAEKGILTEDQCHLNDAGNRIVAEEMLKALEK